MRSLKWRGQAVAFAHSLCIYQPSPGPIPSFSVRLCRADICVPSLSPLGGNAGAKICPCVSAFMSRGPEQYRWGPDYGYPYARGPRSLVMCRQKEFPRRESEICDAGPKRDWVFLEAKLCASDSDVEPNAACECPGSC